MMEDRDGNLWFGHEGAGATRYDGSRFTAYGARDGFTDGDVSSIAQDGDGLLWFGTRDGLFHFDGEAFDTLDAASGLPKGGFIPTLVDRNGQLWFGGLGGLHHFDGARLRQITSEPVWALAASADGSTWFGGDSTLQRIRPGSLVGGYPPQIVEAGTLGRLFFSLFEDRDGVVWIGTFGVARFDGGRIHHVGTPAAQSDALVP